MAMKCTNCKTENLEKDRFCRKCGTKLLQVCPKCGYESLPEDEFCGQCGHALTEDKAPLSIDYSKPQLYTPKFLADKILHTRTAIEGERKLVTVLFADVANYTSISEKLDPEEVYQIMDGCFKILIDEIHRYEGTVDKFTGDGVMALFGAPVAHEDHAQRACYAALAIQKAMPEYAEKIERDSGVEFKMRVGIDSGLVIVSNVGNDLRMDYTAIGDPVNLASRMEGLAEPSTVYVTSDTFKLTEGFFHFESLGKVSVKGKEEPVEAYRLDAAGEIETRFGTAVARGLSRFVGREKEIAALKETFDKAKAGSGQLVSMVGEAGVGKSRLLLEFRESLLRQEYTYLEGRCLHYGNSMPYLPILDTLREFFDIKNVEQESAIKSRIKKTVKKLDVNPATLLPSLYDILSLQVEDKEYLKLEPQQKRDMTFEAIKNLLIILCKNRTLILAVEDLHWIDKTSEEFLTYLICSLANARIMLIQLYRPEYTHSWGGNSYYNEIWVDELSVNPSAELVQSILIDGKVASELSELIVSRATGNPLFIEELTHSLLENNSIQMNNGQYVLRANASDIQVPDTIQGIIAARMDRLEDDLKRTMQVASIIGRDFPYRILHSITDMHSKLRSHLLRLQELMFIYEKSLIPELEYIFKHALMQEVAYESLLLKKRKEFHARIGQAIETLYQDRLEEFYEVLAHHYSKGESLEKAYEYLRLSGKKAASSYSLWEAFYYYSEAINILNMFPETHENKRRQFEVLVLMQTPMRALGYPEKSLQMLQEGERLAREIGDERSLARFQSIMGYYYSLCGDRQTGIEYAKKAFEKVEKAQDTEMVAQIGVDLCASYAFSGEFSNVVELVPRILNLLEKSDTELESFGGNNLYNWSLCTYGWSLGMMGHFAEGFAQCEKGLSLARDTGNMLTLQMAEFYSGLLFLVRGEGEKSVEHVQKAMKYGEEAHMIIFEALSWGLLGIGYHILGDSETSRSSLRNAFAIASRSGVHPFLSVIHWIMGWVHLDSGNVEAAQTCLEEAVKLAQDNNENWVEGISRIYLGRALGKLRISQSSKAEEQTMQGIIILDEGKVKPLSSIGHLFLGDLYVDTGQREKALQTLKKAEAAFQEMGIDYWLRRTQEVLERVEG
jgi:class 3 adenylate cyclase/tetratricopeptide (TPR) repeat protein